MTSSRNTAEIIYLPRKAANKRVDTVRKVRTAVDRKFSYLMEGFCQNVAEALFEEMNGIDEQVTLNYRFNVMRALKEDSGALEEHFNNLTSKSWINLVHRKDLQAVSDAPADITEILRKWSDKNLNHYKILLEELRLRFSYLSREELSFHPLLPGNFYLCFWHATEVLEIGFQERKLLLPLFHRFVMDRFGQVLATANQCLAESGVPADIE